MVRSGSTNPFHSRFVTAQRRRAVAGAMRCLMAAAAMVMVAAWSEGGYPDEATAPCMAECVTGGNQAARTGIWVEMTRSIPYAHDPAIKAASKAGAAAMQDPKCAAAAGLWLGAGAPCMAAGLATPK